jgi:hypothetical protein
VFQNFLDENGVISLPTNPGVQATLQGARFDGDVNTPSIFIRGDAHSSSPSLTALLAQTIANFLNARLEYPEPPRTQ